MSNKFTSFLGHLGQVFKKVLGGLDKAVKAEAKFEPFLEAAVGVFNPALAGIIHTTFGLIQNTEQKYAAVAADGTKTGAQKLQEVALTILPTLQGAYAAEGFEPPNLTHVQNYVTGLVAALNSLPAFGVPIVDAPAAPAKPSTPAPGAIAANVNVPRDPGQIG